jgi:hypothetical protein
MTWDFDTKNDSSSKKAEFTKFPEGITRIRIVDSAPTIRWTHWLNQHKRSINCPGRGCPICNIRQKQKVNKEPYSYNMTRRFAINVLNRETGKVEIMEQGKTVFEDIRDLIEDLRIKGITLGDTDLRVKRRGTGKDDTSYRVDLDEKSPLTDAELKLIEENRMDLEDYFKSHTAEQITRILSGEKWEDVMSGTTTSEADEEESDEEVEIK